MAIQHLDLEEQEQLAKIKGFWEQYGRLVLLAVTVFLLIVGGWSVWQMMQNKQAQGVAGIYDQFDLAMQAGDVPKAKLALDEIQKQYASADTTPVASLIGADFMVKMEDTAAAKEILSWVVTQSKEPGYKALAVIRLADLSTNDKEYERALSVLATTKLPEEFTGLVEDRRGNVYYAQGQMEEAKAAYSQAYKALQGQSYQRDVGEKLIMLGVDPVALDESKKVQAS